MPADDCQLFLPCEYLGLCRRSGRFFALVRRLRFLDHAMPIAELVPTVGVPVLRADCMERYCFNNRTLIYLPPCQPRDRWKNLKTQTPQLTLALTILIVSLLSLQPGLLLAVQRSQQGTISINAAGQATPIDHKATGGSATLSLSGNVQTKGSDPLKITGLTGSLQIGSQNYPVFNGQGEANNKGTIEINAKANGKGNHGNNQYELVLHGSMQGNSLTFSSPQSKFASMFFLSLSGQTSIILNTSSSTSSSSTTSSSSSSSSSSSTASAPTVTQTVTETTTETVNNVTTTTLFSKATTTVSGNVTVTQTVNNGTTTTVTNNQTVSETVTQPPNVTVTTTHFNNQTVTITVTSTGANSTITETVTTTATNSTITETTTTTIANTTITITVTNTTATTT